MKLHERVKVLRGNQHRGCSGDDDTTGSGASHDGDSNSCEREVAAVGHTGLGVTVACGRGSSASGASLGSHADPSLSWLSQSPNHRDRRVSGRHHEGDRDRRSPELSRPLATSPTGTTGTTPSSSSLHSLLSPSSCGNSLPSPAGSSWTATSTRAARRSQRPYGSMAGGSPLSRPSHRSVHPVPMSSGGQQGPQPPTVRAMQRIRSKSDTTAARTTGNAILDTPGFSHRDL